MKRKKIWLVVIIICFLLIIYSLNDRRVITFIEEKSKFLIDSLINRNNVSNDIDSFVIEKSKNDVLEKEIDELKNLLELKKIYTSYVVINCGVTIKNKSYWLDTIILDKGKNSGIKKDMAVVTIEGLIGKVSKVYDKSSEVKLISSSINTSIIITTESGEYMGKIDKYDSKSNLLKISDISKNSDVKEGDNILTSGLGGVFPKGIFIGKVKHIDYDQYNLSKNVYIDIKNRFNNINYVGVLKVK